MRQSVFVVSLVALLLVPTVVSAQTYRFSWTTTSDFDDGALRSVNVNAADIADQLQLNLSGIETPFLWVANSGSNTIAQLSTISQTFGGESLLPGQVIRVVEDAGHDDPSRTAVDLDFNCWVGYRGRTEDAIAYLDLNDEGDQFWEDSDYSALFGGSTDTNLVFDRVRAVAINAEGNVFMGSWDSSRITLIQGSSDDPDAPPIGSILNTYEGNRAFLETDDFEDSYRPVVGPGETYGMVVDAFNNLWVAQRSDYFGQYNATTGEHICSYLLASGGSATSLYGITVDIDGNVYAGNWDSDGLWKLPRGAVVACQDDCDTTCNAYQSPIPAEDQSVLLHTGSCDRSRGVAVDQAGNVWVNCYNDDAVLHVDGNTNGILGVYAVGDGPLGITATADGHIWTVNRLGGPHPGGSVETAGYSCPNGFSLTDAGTVTQLRGSDGSVVATYGTCGNGPYTYSDMAGYSLRSVTLRSGFWRQIHDSGIANLEWETVDWNTVMPSGARLVIQVDAANNAGDFDEVFPVTYEITAEEARSGITLDPTLQGQNIVVDAFLFTRNDFIGPVIEDLTVSSICFPDPDICPDPVGSPDCEICNGIDDNCNGAIDEIVGGPDAGLPLTGGACSTGLPGICDAGTLTCQSAEYVCVRDNDPLEEVCDLEDNNCNGEIDEAVTNACGECGEPPTEVCDGEDNDCDGVVDENVQNTCIDYADPDCGSFQTCGDCPSPPVELCDGEDNNCNGAIDEGAAITCTDYATCGVIQVCDTSCPPPPAELCDLEDNNCNGLIDEGALNTCFNFPDCSTYTQCAECPVGPLDVCDNVDNDCDGDVDEDEANACGFCGPLPEEVCDFEDNDCDGDTDEGVQNGCGLCGDVFTEICDGVDNDCDGDVDEGVSNDCGTCGPEPLEVCNGIDDDCNGVIDNGVSNACGGCGLVPAELCDGVDNDCDGLIDEPEETDAACQADLANSVCYSNPDESIGECALPCFASECPQGKVCEEGLCITDPCVGILCDTGFRCDAGECVDLCIQLDVSCEGELVCVGGNCVEDVCNNTGCPNGQTCIDNACVADPCNGVSCLEGEICADGACIDDPCVEVDCDEGFICAVDGTCVDACLGIVCGVAEACDNGFCVSDACFEVSCNESAQCLNGNCVEIDCIGVVCGQGQACSGGQCETTRAGGPCGDGLSECGDGLLCFNNSCYYVDDPGLTDLEDFDPDDYNSDGSLRSNDAVGGDGDGSGSPSSDECGCGATGAAPTSAALLWGTIVGLWLGVPIWRRRRRR